MSKIQITKQVFKPCLPNRLDLPGAEVFYTPQLFTRELANNLFQQLYVIKEWESRSIRVFNKPCQQNRKTLYYGEKGTNYRYSGINNPGDGNVPTVIRQITSDVETYLKSHNMMNENEHFNYWLGNLYDNGEHNIGMHSDDEKGLHGPIASLSFGSSRYFDLKEKPGRDNNRFRLNLETGSLLVMTGNTQQTYNHGVPTQKRIKDPRINLTLRIVG
jgi:alkylated DNA repair dioxygenase AlkB